MTYAQLVRLYGSEAEAARELDIPQTTVNWWARNGIPSWRQAQIESATQGKLLAERRRTGS